MVVYMITYKIHMIRHGLTQANLERKYIGRTDPPLCDVGLRQLRDLQKDWGYPSVQQVYSSPLIRATQTAKLIYPNYEPVLVEGIREIDFGDFEDRTIEDLEKDPVFREWIASEDMAVPNGESGKDVYERSVEALGWIFQEMMDKKLTSVAVITHSGLITGLLANLGLPEREAVRWNCDPGRGYTLLMTPQLWMRDKKFEVYGRIPVPLYTEEEEETAYWQDLDYGDGM
jgi:alpha-ribazole phosphatase